MKNHAFTIWNDCSLERVECILVLARLDTLLWKGFQHRNGNLQVWRAGTSKNRGGLGAGPGRSASLTSAIELFPVERKDLCEA